MALINPPQLGAAFLVHMATSRWHKRPPARPGWNRSHQGAFRSSCHAETENREKTMKGIIAWFLGIPIFVIILLYITGIF